MLMPPKLLIPFRRSMLSISILHAEENLTSGLFALQDCEPNLPGLLPALLKRPACHCKLSPMADIQMTLELLRDDIRACPFG